MSQKSKTASAKKPPRTAAKKAPLGITEVSIRDGSQSLLATRLRTEDILPVCADLDACGFWSVECWGGATYDACLRYLGENPWERLRQFRKAMPNTQLQMLLRGQNLLGYRHYADDVVSRFVEHSAAEGIDVFRVFDALNDVRNMTQALKAVRATGKHAQGTLAYTTSPVHNLKYWLDLAQRIEDCGVDSIAIKDMAGLLRPYDAEELVGSLKQTVSVPIHMQCHATTGLSTATAVKAVEAGLDNVDTSISTLSMTYGHSPTETVAAIFSGTGRDPGLDFGRMEKIAEHLRDLRHRYRQFEGTLRGVDARILSAQVPGGMLSNLESQLRKQGALDKMAEVMEEIPRVRKDLGYIPLVTPSSQIVGTQAVFNVLGGERYGQLSTETSDLIKGLYGATPAEIDSTLSQRVLEGEEPTTVRPADLLQPEMQALGAKVESFFSDNQLPQPSEEEVLIYAMFPHVAEHYFRNKGDGAAFESPPAEVSSGGSPGRYSVQVGDATYDVQVNPAGEVTQAVRGAASAPAAPINGGTAKPAQSIAAPLAGVILSIEIQPGASVAEGQLLLKLEAMKMETEVLAPRAGIVQSIAVAVGDNVASGSDLLYLS